MKRALLALLVARTAHADAPLDRPEAIEVDRDATPPGQAELGFDGGAPIGTWAVGVELGYLARPLRFHTVDIKTYPVDRRETAALGGAIALGDSALVDVRMPLSHQVGARLVGIDDKTPLDPWVPGDLRIGARLRVAERGAVGVFIRGEVTLPTGDDHDFAGDARWSAAWLGIARVTLEHDITLSGTAGIRLRGTEVVVADQTVGDELAWGFGGTVGIPPVLPLWCKPEQLKAMAEVVGVLGDRVAGKHSPSPIEGHIGVIGRVRPEYAIAVRAGTHLDDQIGAPTFRASIDLVYQPSPGARHSAPVATEPSVDDD
jgi:hypothetical protein